MILAATGHRPDKFGNDYDGFSEQVQRVKKTMVEIILRENPIHIISGMALGIDTWWAIAGIKLGCPVHAYVPFYGQESNWPQKSQELYKRVMSKCEKEMIICTGGYASWKMQKRNEAMVDDCTTLVAFWDGSPGGTGNCVAYARKKGKPIIFVDPKTGEIKST